jgi:bud site selection protein 31
MPKIKTIRTKKAPEGWDLIEPTLTDITNKLRDIEQEPIEGKRKNEPLWEIYKLTHQRSRYIFEMFYNKKQISRELYEYCLNEKWADASLIAKWKKSGFEKLCCL